MRLGRAIAILTAGLACCAGLSAVTASKKKSTHHKASSVASHKAASSKKASSTKPASGKAAPSRHTAKSKRAVRPAHGSGKAAAGTTWRSRQTVPTPDRYKEIQTALATKGYLHGEPNGVWGQESADALRRFQQDQNLQASGKLDSLSIIALGLGPKH